MNQQSRTLKRSVIRGISLTLINFTLFLCGITICKSELSAQTISFDIKKGNSVDGDVAVTTGVLKANNGSYQMNMVGGSVNLQKPKEFRLEGWIKNNNATGNNQFSEINFDQRYASNSPDGYTIVSKGTNSTKITIRNIACHESFKAHFSTGYRILADVELVINNNGSGTFKVTCVKLINGFVGVTTYPLNKLPANFPTAKVDLLASGITISPTIMTVK